MRHSSVIYATLSIVLAFPIGAAIFSTGCDVAEDGKTAGEASATVKKLPSLDIVIENYIQALGGREALEKIDTRACTGRLAQVPSTFTLGGSLPAPVCSYKSNYLVCLG